MLMKSTCFATRNLLGIYLLLAVSACSTVGVKEQSMLAKSDYGNLISHVQQNYTYDTMDIGTMDALCQSYFETRNYKNFLECSNVLIRKAPKEGIRRTSTTKRKTGVLFGGIVGGLADSYMTEHFSYEDTVAPMLSKRAMVQLDFENYKAAIETSNQAVALLTRVKTMHPEFLVEAYGISGLAYALSGDRKSAEDRISAIRTIDIESEDADLLRQTALIRIHIALKEYQKAKTAMTANTSSSFLKFVNKIDYAWNMTSRDLKNIEIPNKFMTAKISFETGDWKAAERYYGELLTDPQFQNLGAAYVAALSDRGRMVMKNGRLNEARELFQKAIDVIELQRSTINTEASKIGFVGDKQDIYHQLVWILCDLGRYGEAFEYAERSKSRALVDLLATKKDFALRSENAQEIRLALARQQEAETQAPNPDLPADGRQTRSIQIRTKEYLSDKAPELASLVTVTSQSLSELKALIPPDDILVEYYYGNQDMVAFILSSKGVKAVKLDAHGLLEEVQEYRKILENGGSGKETQIAQKLYMRLFQPIERDLDRPNLIVVPHGALHYLPMNALYDGSGYLIDRYSIRRYLQERGSGQNSGILIFGNPDPVSYTHLTLPTNREV